MTRRWIGWAVWLTLSACLYFFENNTGTRIILLCSLLAPLIPPLRAAFFGADPHQTEDLPAPQTATAFSRREEEEPGDVRPYVPGDPVRRIHWKLSAKKGEPLIREPAPVSDPYEEKQMIPFRGNRIKNSRRSQAVRYLLTLMLLCLALLLLIPQARLGAQTLCNRLFAASEAQNAYVYQYISVPDGQAVTLAILLLILAAGAVILLAVLLRSRLLVLGLMAVCALFQIYFGLSFSGWVNVALFAGLSILLMRQPLHRKEILVFGATALVLSLLTVLLMPGVDVPTETASEAVRDRLSNLSQRITGTAPEAPSGETETRRIHSRSLAAGEHAARTGREFRLVTAEEEQISMPKWVNWLKVILLLILSSLLLILPFAPFLLLNARRKKALAARERFHSENTSEAVCAVFRQVILWLDTTGNGGGNRLYRDWTVSLPDHLSAGYAVRFARCAADYEEAAYSCHTLPEEKRTDALDLLRETETVLWKAADLKQKLYLKYWLCLCE